MKKLAFVCLLIVLLAVFAACADDNWEHPPVGDGLISFRSFDEYQSFFKRYPPPDDYVLYDDLEELGHLTFANISGLREKPIGRNNFYTFVDETGFEYSLYIDKKPVQEYDAGLPKRTYITLDSPDNREDLRGIRSDDHSEYWIGDIQYVYQGGRLDNVQWETKTHCFNVWIGGGDGDILEYDLNSDTFVARLLRESTAEKAIAELNTRITLSLVWRKFCRYWLPWILVAVVIVGALGFAYYRRTRKKNSAS